MDRHDLYEACVQSAAQAVRFLEALHAGSPWRLHEDFAGTAAVSRAWAAQSVRHSATAVDHDASVLSRARGAPRVEPIVGDVRRVEVAEADVDVVFVGNFSIGEIGARGELVDYLRRARRRLRPGGIFVADTYGGESCFRRGGLERRHALHDGAQVHYTFEQREADPLTARVTDVLHFRVLRAGEVVAEFPEAFVYRWRLWSVPELREACLEAGFDSTEVHVQLESPRAVTDPRELEPSFVAAVVARVGTAAAARANPPL